MSSLRLFLFLFPLSLLSACSNMAASDKAASIFPGAHEFGSTAVAFAPNGKLAVSGGHRGDVKLWDLQNGKTIVEANPHEGAVRAIAFMDNGIFATASDDGRIFLWDNGKTRTQNTSTLATSLVWFQGKLVSGHDDEIIRFWDSGLKETARLEMDDEVVGLAAHGDMLAVALDDRILVLDAQLKTRKVLETRGTTPHDIQFSPDGKRIAAGGWFRLHVWDVETGKHQSVRTEHGGLLTSVSFSPDGKHIVSLGRHTDSAIRIMDTENFKVERRYQAHELCGAMIRYSPDGLWLASASDDESIRFYDLSKEYQPGKKYEAPFISAASTN